MQVMKKLLVAFDFDDTLIDANSDLYIRKLIPNGGKVPESITKLYSSSNWTKYMGEIFKHLNENGIGREKILSCVEEIDFVPGMKKLLRFISESNCDSVIISDSNSVFIDHILAKAGLKDTVKSVFTNPAAFDDAECLQIQFYHTQDWCDLSTINLCKGHILEEHISEQGKKGISYQTVAYVGDGSNDLCPALRLKSSDLVFPRKGFRLIDKISSSCFPVKARVLPWSTGFEILSSLQSFV